MSLEINDLLGLEKPLTKLLEVIQAGCGTLYDPTHLRRMARARADEIRILEAAKTDAAVSAATALSKVDSGSLSLLTGVPADVVERARLRLAHQEVARQQNLDRIVVEAAAAIPETVDENRPEPAWVSRFFELAAEVRTSDMQMLWGKVLAGETSTPGRFSLRTLEVLRNLSSNEATLFTRACALLSANEEFIVAIPGHGALEPDEEEMKNFGMAKISRLLLSEAGLLHTEHIKWPFTLPLRLHSNGQWISFASNGLGNPNDSTFSRRKGDSPDYEKGRLGEIARDRTSMCEIGMPVLKLTVAGRQLRTLVADNLNHEYVVSVRSALLRDWGIQITLEEPLRSAP